MSDLNKQLQNAVEKAAEFQMLGGLVQDEAKRKDYRAKAEFYQDVARELRKAMANAPLAENPAPLPEIKLPPGVRGE